MEKTDWNPGSLLHLSGSYWQTCTLHTGVKLDIFTRLEDKSATGDSLAEKMNMPPRSLTMLLDALAAMDLLDKSNTVFSNTPAASAFLVRTAPGYMGHMILHHHHLAESWVNLDKAVRGGKSIRNLSAAKDPAMRESFLMGMFNIAMGIAPELSNSLDLSSCTKLLDLGGGPGTYAVHFCRANPGLNAVVFDLPTTQPFAENIFKRFNVRDQVSFVPGDYTQGDLNLDPNFDGAWLSHILHGEAPKTAEKIIARAVKVLAPGAVFFIHEFILDDTKDGPLFPALFSLNMLLGTEGGQAYSQNELSQMMADQGLTDIRRLDFKGPTESGILFARKA